MPDPKPIDSRNARARTAALIVAAGSSRRMGHPKALLPWRGQSLLRHVAKIAVASPCDPVRVVLGDRAEALESELRGLAVEAIRNPVWETGMGSSIAVGTRSLPPDCRGVVVLLCDQPHVDAQLVADLIEARDRSGKLMAACAYRDTLGPPACFDASLFGRLASLRGDRGAKSLLLESAEAVARVEFERGAIDIDTPEDYDRALAALEETDTP